MKTSIFTLLLVLALCPTLLAQYQYEVRTLLPQNSRLVDDGLSIDENGTVYGSYWGIWQGEPGRHILRYHADGSHDTLSTGLVRPNGMSYHQGKLYVASSGTGEAYKINTQDGSKRLLATIPGGVSNVIPVPSTDSLIALAWGQKRIIGLRPDGSNTTVISSPLLNGAVGGVFDPAGNFYIGNFNDGNILKYAKGQIEVFASLGGGIGFLTYSDSALLVTNHSDKKVYRVALPTGAVEVIAGDGKAVMKDGIGEAAAFMSPNGIVATATGDTIYVSEFAGKALRQIIRTRLTTRNASLQTQASITVYPLPTSGKIAFKNLPLAELSSGILRDSNGKTVKKFNLQEFQADSLDLSPLPAGTYLLSLLNHKQQPFFSTQIPLIK